MYEFSRILSQDSNKVATNHKTLKNNKDDSPLISPRTP